MCCPTDIRKTHLWIFGEDAIFCPPCGPDHDYYGQKPTCWRDWPSSGADWRDGTCGGVCLACQPAGASTATVPENEFQRLPPVAGLVEQIATTQPISTGVEIAGLATVSYSFPLPPLPAGDSDRVARPPEIVVPKKEIPAARDDATSATPASQPFAEDGFGYLPQPFRNVAEEIPSRQLNWPPGQN